MLAAGVLRSIHASVLSRVEPGPWSWKRDTPLWQFATLFLGMVHLGIILPIIPQGAMLVFFLIGSHPRSESLIPRIAQPRESKKKEEVKIPRDAAFFKDETVASQESAKSTEARAAKTVGSNTAARSGPEVGSQREANETKGQEALSKQEETAAVAAEEPSEKSSSNPFSYDVVTE